MSVLLRISSRKTRAIRTSTRVLFLVLGFSLIVMELAVPPVKPLWMVLGFFLAAFLILFSIIGLSPRLRVSSYGEALNNTYVHVTASLLIGMGIIIASMVHPPVHLMWYAFFNFVGIALVFDAIITSSWNLKKARKAAKEQAGNTAQLSH